ncbi:hemin-degrading factor [Aureibacter tunicatorum]|uniref:Hemin transport protein n=1 Tax=Aureibacter tunicatorum TaxID=866807 RepID=A0AAE3XLA1_9BACT|nr:ChuX/HutX family heme-like substrate-binding protein [Aureibacter tunicatorum]MDR6238020.1 putative hemin transport protein [Aureibacter tunicatorum]BDD03053.1 hemin-degrading factor [Aureibacter tunicatorum]
MENIVDNLQAKAEKIKKDWADLLNENPKLRIRDAANQLEASEAELLATKVDGENVIRLEGAWDEMVKRFPAFGQVMSITRSEGCVLEHKGAFEKIGVFGKGMHHMGQVIGPIETRLFFHSWKSAFAVKQPHVRGFQQSVQFFDKAGDAITKVYLKEKGDQEAFDNFISDYTSSNQDAHQAVEEMAEPATLALEEVDAEALTKGWDELQDTHDFFSLLRKHKAHRLDALKIVEGKHTYQIDPATLESMLNVASETQMPIMIFAGNRGNIQIHQDVVKKIFPMENWLNIMDPDFNMHLKTDLIDTAWVVKKPTKDGVVTSIELFDKDRTLICQFFGLRKPGSPEREDWRQVVSDLGQK